MFGNHVILSGVANSINGGWGAGGGVMHIFMQS